MAATRGGFLWWCTQRSWSLTTQSSYDIGLQSVTHVHLGFLPSLLPSFLPAFLPLPVRQSLPLFHPRTQWEHFQVFGNYSESHCWQASSWFGLAPCCRESCVCTVLSLPCNSHGIHAGAAQAAQLLCPQMTECTVVCYTVWILHNLSWWERVFWYSISAAFQCWPGDPQDKEWGTHPIHPTACSMYLHAFSVVFGLVANVPSLLWTYGAIEGGEKFLEKRKIQNQETKKMFIKQKQQPNSY